MVQAFTILVAGGAGIAIAALLWALRISDGARGAAKKYRERARELEEKLARSDSVFGAHPGVVLVWEEDEILEGSWGKPSVYGSHVALAAVLNFTDDSMSSDPAVRLLEGLGDLEARDGAGRDATLRERLMQLRTEGAPFSLTIIGPNGRFLEADGRTAGGRAVLWVSDSTIKGLEESGARGRLEEARQIIARDPTAFLEMLGKAPFIAWRLSGAGRLQWVNESYLKAVEGKNLDHVLDRQIMLDQEIASQAQTVLTDKTESRKTRYIVIDGERRAMRVLMFPLSGGVAGMAFDVSEEEAARETLERHRRAHDDTLNHVSDAVAIFGADRKLSFHNKHFEELWDLNPRFLLEKPSHGEFLDRLRESKLLPAQQKYSDWRTKELDYNTGGSKRSIDENMWMLPDGRTLQVTRQKHPLGGILLLFKDISDELTLKANYNALINQQKATLDKLSEAVAVYGGDGGLRLSNASFEKLWQLEPAKLKNAPEFDEVAEMCAPLFHDKSVWAAIKGRVTNPTPEARQEFRGEMKRSDGSIVTFLTQPLPDGATLIAFVDATASRRVEGALRERAEAFQAADRLKTEFVQNVSYQLRSPLTTILGYAEFLESGKQGSLNAQQLENVNSILQASDHLSRLIENILDLATIEAGRMDLDLKDLDLKSLIDESVEMVVANAADTKVSIKVDCPATIGSMHADERRIKQILFNLLTNALRFTTAGDTIKVKAEKAEGVIRLQVTDTGKGVAYEQQAEAFDAFTSGDNRGAGLGLALVRSFVELHGGWVAMKSKPTKGATVICCLPEFASPKDMPPTLELANPSVAAQ
ncbi:sensor histidine kinase [Hirschia baltica]|uniref:histidine kinase n=1 Tax=Hirschia baltica (strain ATCC 49814 / DSM 5838 / IFAM 1418) TaxID=582402 RepID=C6XL67_HIRBI|nr:PAS domain-containing sensor histidine kinase [Hirschia baltica]ACT57896.1 histidine kinase [Hirschia baltica ATCC 49814]